MLMFIVFLIVAYCCLDEAETHEDRSPEKYMWLAFGAGCFALALVSAGKSIFE